MNDSTDGLLKQSWWHIEDEIDPSDGRFVYRVLDYYIEKDYFKKGNFIPISLPKYFVNFKVRNKNSGKELSFLEYYDPDENVPTIMRVNLGLPLEWPPVCDTNYHHVKIQYEYIDIWPIFEKRCYRPLGTKFPSDDHDKDYEIDLPDNITDRLNLLWRPGYNGTFPMDGHSQGEISVTVPLGMKISDKGNSAKIDFYDGPIESTEERKMEYGKPHITSYNNKLKYHYIIDGDSYDHVLDSKNKGEMYFVIYYDVRNDRKFYLIPGFSIGLFLVILAVPWEFSNLFYFVILLLSLVTLYITLRKEKYQIPFNNFVFWSIPLLPILLSIKLYYTQIFSTLTFLYNHDLIPILLLISISIIFFNIGFRLRTN
jgi:hypothetical protein